MKKRYTLYLDESETHKFNPTVKSSEEFHFCMAGVIVAEDNIQNLENSVNNSNFAHRFYLCTLKTQHLAVIQL